MTIYFNGIAILLCQISLLLELGSWFHFSSVVCISSLWCSGRAKAGGKTFSLIQFKFIPSEFIVEKKSTRNNIKLLLSSENAVL